MAHPPNPPARVPSARVPYEFARSWLLVSAHKPELFAKSSASPADAVIIDLEDAVAPEAKDRARSGVAQWLRDGALSAWVRINDATTKYWADDLVALRGLPGVEGIVLAKVEDAEQVDATAERMSAGVPIVALVESAVGIESALDIARCARTSRIAFGSGDFRRDTGMADDSVAMAYPRSRLTVVSRAAGLPPPIDGPTRVADQKTLLAQTADAAAVGMTGRLCLRIEQTAVVNAHLSPTSDDIEEAKETIRRCATIRDPSDVPRLAQARKVLELARVYGAV
ncbi:HpcH/HpaI aldolase/citrate lyase family protein [Gordonia sp. CPCC 205333]|uniref:HpcH/HpaI aldolase/citrate lyase family protein n=1 Tax=Gordonia sp. CPCC 205333 TaxID=3140790 RepID=UPI003AF385C2